MWQAAKYTLPAFLAPLAFVVTDNGSHLLLQGSAVDIVWTTAVAMLAVAALAAATGGWLRHRASALERALCLPAAVLLLFLQPVSIAVGVGFLAIALALNVIRARPTRLRPIPSPTPQEQT
ncbi:MAG: hypothetical protein ACRCSN_04310 [Dermatophilaceae bacterium]